MCAPTVDQSGICDYVFAEVAEHMSSSGVCILVIIITSIANNTAGAMTIEANQMLF